MTRALRVAACVVAPLVSTALLAAQATRGSDGAARPAAVSATTPAAAAGLDPQTLLNPPADSWPTYHGDYTGQRHSRLTRITPANVDQLTLAWTFQTGQAAESSRRRSWSTA